MRTGSGSWWERITARSRPMGLRVKIVAGIALLTAVLILLISVVVLRVTERNLTTLKVREGRLILDIVNAEIGALHATHPELSRDPYELRLPELIDSLASRLGLLDFTMTDASFRVMTASGDAEPGTVVDDPDVRAAQRTGRTQYHFVPDPEQEGMTAVSFAGPVFAGGRVVAIFRFSLSMADIGYTILLTRRLLIFYILLDAVLVMTAGAFLLSRLVLRPIEDLAGAVERVGEGDYDVVIPRGRPDEIGRLSESTAGMVEGLRKSRENQERQMRSLRRINEDLQQAQKEILSTDRLAYVGRVAAGVAHEVGNPLAAIVGYLEILGDDPDLPDEMRDYVRRIESETARIDDIIRSLLDFAKPAGAGDARVDAAALVDRAVDIVKKQRIMDRVTIEHEVAGEGPFVWADAKLLVQVLVNLLINARDAMGGEGRIEIKTSTIVFERLAESMPSLTKLLPEDNETLHNVMQRSIRFSGKVPFPDGAPVVKLSVKDEGSGIPESVFASVFDPFYTTKTPGQGTGLGLAISQRIVEAAGGVIRVESRTGKGTVFTVYLPLHQPESGRRDEADEQEMP